MMTIMRLVMLPEARYISALTYKDIIMSMYDLRVQAAKAGLKHFQGPACVKGHDGKRFTSNGGCCECSRIRSQVYQQGIRDILAANKNQA